MELTYEDLVALDALGQLDAAEERLMHALAPTGDPRAVADSADALSLLARALTRVSPPPGVKSGVLAQIAAQDDAAALPNTMRASEGVWRRLPYAGVSAKELSVEPSRGLVTMLLRMRPGSSFPAHEHHGPEECFVVEGNVRVGALQLSAGDFHHADAGTQHGEIVSETGCTLLLVVDAADYLVA
jgi:anti-sigma factor ChrR (cupin superfamily)